MQLRIFLAEVGEMLSVYGFLKGLKIVRSKAKFILFVEKDAIFQRLIGEQIFDTHGPLIMITGKEKDLLVF
jgi:DNA topoisomerase VI subunit A